jgi:hypothetical protein
MTLARPLAAEFIGTFWLVFGGCGSAVLSAAFPNVGIGLLGVSFALLREMNSIVVPVTGRVCKPIVESRVVGSRIDRLNGDPTRRSSRSAAASPSRACLLAQYAPKPQAVSIPPIELTNRLRPRVFDSRAHSRRRRSNRNNG